MTKIYVGGIPFNATDEELGAHFGRFGSISSVQLATDQITGRNRGFGFIDFEDAKAAETAVAALNGEAFQGRYLTVNFVHIRSREKSEAVSPTADKPGLLAEFLCDRPIIEISNQVSFELMRHLQNHPMDLKNIDRRRFEELVAEIWNGFGYDVELTQQTCDGGVDVIAIRRAIVAERYLIECKRPKIDNCVGIRPVRELYGVLSSQQATKAILATTAYFSRDATIFLEKHEWQLEGRDFDGLMLWIAEYVQRKQTPRADIAGPSLPPTKES
jgi:restriction endonuclease Mrr